MSVIVVFIHGCRSALTTGLRGFGDCLTAIEKASRHVAKPRIDADEVEVEAVLGETSEDDDADDEHENIDELLSYSRKHRQRPAASKILEDGSLKPGLIYLKVYWLLTPVYSSNTCTELHVQAPRSTI